jgi:pimeloyl-ACP methyl ester carboxylesterase
VRIAVDGMTMGYTVEGQGPPVVLLHGFPLNRAMWGPQVEALRGRFTVITPDLLGFGESDVPPAPDRMTMDTFADAVLRLLDALGHERVILGGFSMGGYVLFRVYALAPGRVGGLIIADSRAGPDSDEARQRRMGAIARIREQGPEGFVGDFIAGLVGATTKNRSPRFLETVRRLVGTPPVPALVGALTAMAGRPDSRPLLASVAVPTLVLVGEEDTITPPDAAREMASGIRGARLVTIPAAGHLANLEVADLFNASLLDFAGRL